MPVGLAIGTAAIGAGASIYGSNKAAKASKNALNASLAQQERVWDTVNPFLSSSKVALDQISDPTKVLGNFQASPDYEFRKSQGLDAVTTDKAVNGLLRSGSALKAVTKYAGDLASGEFGNWWNREKGLSDQGLEASRIGAGLAGQSQQAIQANGTNQGNAAVSTANAVGQFGGSIFDIIGKHGGGGGGSSYGGVPAGGWSGG